MQFKGGGRGLLGHVAEHIAQYCGHGEEGLTLSQSGAQADSAEVPGPRLVRAAVGGHELLPAGPGASVEREVHLGGSCCQWSHRLHRREIPEPVLRELGTAIDLIWAGSRRPASRMRPTCCVRRGVLRQRLSA